MRPLVFLDLDDVLCLSNEYHSGHLLKFFQQKIPDYPELWANLVDADAAENLRLLNAEFIPRFVISSSWATYLTREQMTEALVRTGLEFVVANFHDEWKTPRAFSSSRRDEIEWWLDAHRQPGEPFIIIDDSRSGMLLAHSPLALDGHVVLCTRGVGFTVEMLKDARRLLQQQGTA